MGIARQAIAQNFCIDFRAARFGVFIFLQYNHARAFAHNEPVTVAIPWTACLLRFIAPLGRQRLARIEARNTNFTNWAFCTACNHHICIVPLDQTRCVPNSMSARGTGRYNRMVWPTEAIFDRHLPRD